MVQVTVNTESKLFVQNLEHGVTCMGFDHLFEQLQGLVTALKLSATEWLDEAERGTIAQYEKYQKVLSMAREKGGIKTTWFNPNTPAKVRKVLEDCRKDERLIRVFYGDTDTGRSWLEENDVIGTVGRSTGIMKVPLLVPEGECGGGSLLDHCIVKIVDADTLDVLYEHKSFHVPEMTISPLAKPIEGLTHEVLVDGEVHARFKNMAQACQWVAFMHGSCMRNPSDVK